MLMQPADWAKIEFFTPYEFRCRHCGRVEIDAHLVQSLEALRSLVGFPLMISSGYRCPSHPLEVQKGMTTGTHTKSIASDLRVYGQRAVEVIGCAIRLGFRGIGIQQKGPIETRFIHLDFFEGDAEQPRPWIWSY